MATTSRALAFASRWFNEATVRRTFEPLIADWQREWQDAAPSDRLRVSLRGLAAFICAVIVSSPRVLLEPTPSTVSNRVVSRIARFAMIAAAILSIPFAIEMRSFSLHALLTLSVLTSSLTLVFPFAMITATDAIRCHEPLPPPVERALAVKLGIVAVLLMVCFNGWVVPIANQAFRSAVSSVGTSAPARGIRELTTIELITDASRAQAGETTNAGGRAAVIRRELNNRAHLALLPALLLWLRWGMLDRPRRRWYSPLPSWLVTPLLMVAFLVLNVIGINFSRSVAVSAAIGVWLPAFSFIAAGLIARWSRPPVMQLEAP